MLMGVSGRCCFSPSPLLLSFSSSSSSLCRSPPPWVFPPRCVTGGGRRGCSSYAVSYASPESCQFIPTADGPYCGLGSREHSNRFSLANCTDRIGRTEYPRPETQILNYRTPASIIGQRNLPSSLNEYDGSKFAGLPNNEGTGKLEDVSGCEIGNNLSAWRNCCEFIKKSREDHQIHNPHVKRRMAAGCRSMGYALSDPSLQSEMSSVQTIRKDEHLKHSRVDLNEDEEKFHELERAVADRERERGKAVNGKDLTIPTKGQGDYSTPLTPLERVTQIYDKVLVVNNISMAKSVVKMLTTKYRKLIHSCDTEVANIDVKLETPVNHGEIICFSIYSGLQANFGDNKSCIWVDTLDGGRELLMEFAPFFEDPQIRKVWHNYSFDCHIIENYGIKVAGFHADTMHLARLWDSSRKISGGYSLEALSSDKEIMSGGQSGDEEKLTLGKLSMRSIFGKKKVKKDGSEGKIIIVDPVEVLQREERVPWICYSALDAISTLALYESLKHKLTPMEWILDGEHRGSMYDFYEEYWLPFGDLLVQMEKEGVLIDREHLSNMEAVAIAEQKVAVGTFQKWASKLCPDAEYMNVGSDTQIRQLFFGGTMNSKDQNEFLPEKKTFKVLNVNKVIEDGRKAPLKFRNITLEKIGGNMQTEIFTNSGWPSVGGDALKTFAGKVSADQYFMDPNYGFQSESTEEIPLDSEEEDQFKEDACSYGTAYDAFGGGREGKEACHAIAALCEVCSIDSLISNFILPLQGDHISGKSGRIHCSLNINTETGRLSCRRPNLQNQPALEKDRYKIRKAFIAGPGNSLIVADYGQLELRVLAHLANCKSMLDAFKAGGDFHSRTAMNMYSHVREAVDQKHVLLEWHPQPGEEKPPVPLLKDAFASERRKAKMLNFSIAYGKTPVGLARDWKVHDEVILEGPTESAEIAKAIVVECMSKPFYGTNFLKVDLSVDAKCAQNWYAAK
ncbi:hypothetical protein QJS04_geneDACA018197 [Acorus gramineus]|uniref:DNA-directed DNA polymerase family A palm domain-containing protein n=1 Tax=Acorus gramineus TaxID=55184 RepID=A0AAV9BX94_ACOGR|nr:hypothetical protein QJS04_geneDACA018197 [Acorus gramineus]